METEATLIEDLDHELTLSEIENSIRDEAKKYLEFLSDLKKAYENDNTLAMSHIQSIRDIMEILLLVNFAYRQCMVQNSELSAQLAEMKNSFSVLLAKHKQKTIQGFCYPKRIEKKVIKDIGDYARIYHAITYLSLAKLFLESLNKRIDPNHAHLTRREQAMFKVCDENIENIKKYLNQLIPLDVKVECIRNEFVVVVQQQIKKKKAEILLKVSELINGDKPKDFDPRLECETIFTVDSYQQKNGQMKKVSKDPYFEIIYQNSNFGSYKVVRADPFCKMIHRNEQRKKLYNKINLKKRLALLHLQFLLGIIKAMKI